MKARDVVKGRTLNFGQLYANVRVVLVIGQSPFGDNCLTIQTEHPACNIEALPLLSQTLDHEQS